MVTRLKGLLMVVCMAALLGCSDSGGNSAATVEKEYTLPTGRNLALQKYVLDQVLAHEIHDRTFESMAYLKDEIEAISLVEGISLEESEKNVLAGSVVMNIPTDASFFLRGEISDAVGQDVDELLKKVQFITDLDEIERYYRDVELNGKVNAWANDQEDIAYARAYFAIVSKYLADNNDVIDRYVDAKIDEALGALERAGLENVGVLHNSTMRGYIEFLNRHRYLAATTDIRGLETLPAGELSETFVNFDYDRYMHFVLSGYLAFYLKNMGLATDSELYAYCSSKAPEPFNALGVESTLEHFDKEGFCTFASSVMSFPLEVNGEPVSVGELSADARETAGLDGYRYFPPRGEADGSDGVAIPMNTKLTTPADYKNATAHQGLLSGDITSSPAKFLAKTHGLMYSQTGDGSLCEFLLSGDGSSLAVSNCSSFSPPSDTLVGIDRPMAIEAMDLDADLTSELFVAGRDGTIYVYDMVNSKVKEEFTNAFSFPTPLTESSLEFSGCKLQVDSQLQWVSMRALYDRATDEVILLLAANSTTYFIMGYDIVVDDGGLLPQYYSFKSGWFNAATNICYYTYDLKNHKLTLKKDDFLRASPTVDNYQGSFPVTHYAPVGVALAKDYVDSPFFIETLPEITVYAIYNKNDYAESVDYFSQPSAALSGNMFIAAKSLASFAYDSIDEGIFDDLRSDFETPPSGSPTYTTAPQAPANNCFHTCGNDGSSSAFREACAALSPGEDYGGDYDTLVQVDGNVHTIIWPPKIIGMIDTPICNKDDPDILCEQGLGNVHDVSTETFSKAGHAYTAGISMGFKVKAEGDGFTSGLDTSLSVASEEDKSQMATVSREIAYIVREDEPPNIILQGFSATVLPAKVVLALGDSKYKKGQRIYPTVSRSYGIAECAITNSDCSNQYFDLEKIYNDVIGHNYLQNDYGSYLNPPASFKADPDADVAPLINYFNVGALIVAGAGGYELSVSMDEGHDRSSEKSFETDTRSFSGAIAGIDTAALGATFSVETTIKVSAGIKIDNAVGWTTGFSEAFKGSYSVTANNGKNAFPGYPALSAATALYTYTYDLGNLESDPSSSDWKNRFCVTCVPPDSTTGEEVRMCEKQTFIISSPYLCEESDTSLKCAMP